jgi:hypothetical protein
MGIAAKKSGMANFILTLENAVPLLYGIIETKRMLLSSSDTFNEIPDALELLGRLKSCLDDFDRHPVLRSHPLAAQLDLVIARLEVFAKSSSAKEAD